MDTTPLPLAELLSVYGMSGAGISRCSERRGSNALLDEHLRREDASFILISDPGLSTETVAGVIEGPTTAFPAPGPDPGSGAARLLLWSPQQLASALGIIPEEGEALGESIAEAVYADESITAIALGTWNPGGYGAPEQPVDGDASAAGDTARVLPGAPVLTLLIRPQRLTLGEASEAEAEAVPLREAIFAALGRAEAAADRTVSSAGMCAADALTAATAIAAWHHSHLFSPRTGELTRPASSGWVRVDAEGRESFPRQDMAVIVAVTDSQDRLLLGRNAHWPPNRYSCFAGFVDAGESVEAAAARELFEEAGVRVSSLRFFGSQPWPFPRSMMLGFTAATEDAPEPDGEEIVQVRAFTRSELRAATASGEAVLPSGYSISSQLIQQWMDRESE